MADKKYTDTNTDTSSSKTSSSTDDFDIDAYCPLCAGERRKVKIFGKPYYGCTKCGNQEEIKSI